MSLNKIMLIGRLGDDPTLRYTQSGKAVANFSIATSQKSGDKEEVEWHKIVVWDKLADNCKAYLSKGKQAYVEGRVATRKYEKDGQTHYSSEVVAHTVQFLSAKDDGQTARPAPAARPAASLPHAAPAQAFSEFSGSLDDIPFMRLSEFGL